MYKKGLGYNVTSFRHIVITIFAKVYEAIMLGPLYESFELSLFWSSSVWLQEEQVHYFRCGAPYSGVDKII